MATVDLVSVDKLFDYRFYIPAYQRGYRWDETQIKELLEDLYEFTGKGKDCEYCLQPIIVKKRSDSSWELVDGQQRLTALWVFFALYYCSNRRDVIGIEFKKYDLEYERKKVFTDLFSVIEDKIKTVDYVDLREALEEEKSRSIDSRHLIESIDFIIPYMNDNIPSKTVLSNIFYALPRIKVIWYVLDEDEDPIQTFTNVNANKIELTNSELIKAVLLNYSEGRESDNRSIQWEEIEKGLNDDTFWSFVAPTDKTNYSTRIDFLFEIICAREGWLADFSDDDRYRVYRSVIKHLNSTKEAAEIWKKVQETYDILRDWYDNYFFYHIIGLLVIVSKVETYDLINQLYKAYTESSKKDFREYLLAEIKKLYMTSKTRISNWTKIEIGEALEKMLYSETGEGNAVIKNVLLLYNIALLVIAGNEYERFPFDLYKADIWSIEHINPQTPKESSEEEKYRWLRSYRKIITKESVLSAIDQYLQRQNVSFDDVVELIEKEFEFGNNDSIGNLVLLDFSTNSEYKNDCFSEKRLVIIEKERTNQDITESDKKDKKKRKYIPIGTKWVFLKGYERADELKIWGPSDMEEYMNDMTEKIYTVLGGN